MMNYDSLLSYVIKYSRTLIVDDGPPPALLEKAKPWSRLYQGNP